MPLTGPVWLRLKSALISVWSFSAMTKTNRYPDAPPVPKTVLINPVIRPLSDEIDAGWEGCLSIPGMRGIVPRWAKIHYEGFDQFGNKISRNADGFHARVCST